MKRPWRTGSVARPTSGLSTNGGTRLAKPSPQTVRGRISNPMPIPNPADDEFPIRQPGTSIALSPGEEPRESENAIQDAAPSAEAHTESEREQARPDSTILEPHLEAKEDDNESEHIKIAEPKDPAEQTQPEAQTIPIKPEEVHTTPAKPAEPTLTPPNNARHSIISSDTARTKSSKGRAEKKKSGLRGALGKLFGRRRKTDSVVETPSPAPQKEVTDHHHSDPNALRREPSKVDTKRSVSLPVTDYDRALRSHSIGPEDVIAIDSARNSLAADGLLYRRRPGAASTHLIGVRRTRDSEWAGLTPRPASSHAVRDAKADGVGEAEPEDPAQIGRAITSDFTGLKRRSRSLTYLADLPQDQDGGVRRSNELRFWRQSYEPNLMSPISSNAEDTDIGPLPMDVAQDAVPGTPLQPFTFGDIATMNEMAGMRITEAVSMDSRIGSLEARMQRMEQVVTQLCNAMPNFKPRLDAPARTMPAQPDENSSGYTMSIAPLKMSAYPASGREMRTSTRPSTQQSHMSKTSFGDTQTFVDSGPRGPPTFPQGHDIKSSKDRPISNATIRGATSLPHLSKDVNKTFTIDHYTTLMALIDTERSARQALEAQVKTLGHQVQIMSNTIRKRNGRTNSTVSAIQKSAFDVDEDDEEELHAALARDRNTYGGPVASNDDDDSETFTTPHEEGQTFEDQLDEEEERRRKAERTMSLSRLTLGGAVH